MNNEQPQNQRLEHSDPSLKIEAAQSLAKFGSQARVAVSEIQKAAFAETNRYARELT